MRRLIQAYHNFPKFSDIALSNIADQDWTAPREAA